MNIKTESWLCLAVVGALCFFSTVAIGSRAIARNSAFAPVADAGSIFDSKCAKCHGHDGRSKTMRGRLTHARDLSDANWQSEVSDERLFNSIGNGKGKMPSFKKSLSDNDIDSLVSYVRRLKR